MKKILIVINSLHFDVKMLDFPAYISTLTSCRFIGLFIDRTAFEATPALKQIYGGAFVEEIVDDPEEIKQKTDLVKKNMQLFKDACMERGINSSIHHNEGLPLKEVIVESRFADLLIIDPKTSFTGKDESVPTKFVFDLLADAECPVIVSPLNFETIDEIIFTYDGSNSSVYAIKQFTNLFPELSSKKVVVTTMNKNNDNTIEQKEKLNELLQGHYKNIVFEILTGNAEDDLFIYYLEEKNKILIMGALGRKRLSYFFKRSTAETILKTCTLPIFIAHR